MIHNGQIYHKPTNRQHCCPSCCLLSLLLWLLLLSTPTERNDNDDPTDLSYSPDKENNRRPPTKKAKESSALAKKTPLSTRQESPSISNTSRHVQQSQEDHQEVTPEQRVLKKQSKSTLLDRRPLSSSTSDSSSEEEDSDDDSVAVDLEANRKDREKALQIPGFQDDSLEPLLSQLEARVQQGKYKSVSSGSLQILQSLRPAYKEMSNLNRANKQALKELIQEKSDQLDDLKTKYDSLRDSNREQAKMLDKAEQELQGEKNAHANTQNKLATLRKEKKDLESKFHSLLTKKAGKHKVLHVWS